MPHPVTGTFRQLNSSNVANLLYTSQIASAYRRFAFLVDPDYATQNEPEAWQKIRRDTDIAHAIMKRRQATAGLDWGHDGVEEEEADKLAVEWMDWNLRHIKRFHFSRFNMAEATFRGSSWAFIEGDRQPRQFPGDRPRTIWAPRRLRHVDRFRFRLVRVDDLTDGPGDIETVWEMFSIKTHLWTRMNAQALRFFVRHDFEQTEDTVGYGRGLLQSIFYFWRAKAIVLSQGLAGLERWAQGLIDIGIDGLRPGTADRNNDQIVDEWIEEYNKHRTQHVLPHDIRDVIKVHDMPAKGGDQVMAMYDRLQQAIDRLILTSTLPTGGGDSSSGSNARAVVEQEEMDATFQADRQALSETLDDSVSRLVWNRNAPLLREFFSERGMKMPNRPRFKIRQRKINDPERNSKILETALRAGVPVKARQAYELLELEQPADDDDVIAPMQGGGLGGPGGLPFQAPIVKLRALGIVSLEPIPERLPAVAGDLARILQIRGIPTSEAVFLAMQQEHEKVKMQFQAELAKILAGVRQGDTRILMPEQNFNVHIPDTLRMERPEYTFQLPEQPPPIINFQPQIQAAAAPNVTVRPEILLQAPPPAKIEFNPQINVAPTPVNVNVAAPQVTIEQPKRAPIKSIKFEEAVDGEVSVAKIIREKGDD